MTCTASPGRACSYYVTLTTHLDQMAEPIGHEALTDAERALYRPDLPLSLARSATLSWYDPSSTYTIWGSTSRVAAAVAATDRLASGR